MLILGGPSFAETESPTNTISVIELYPWGYNEDGPQGIHSEIVRLLGKQLGQPYTPIVKPYARVENDLKTGKSMFSFLAGGSLNRGGYSIEGPTLFDLKFGVIVRASDEMEELIDLTGLEIGVMRGLSISDCFNSSTNTRVKIDNCSADLPSFYKFPINEYSQGLKMLAAGRLDGLVGSIPTMMEILNTKKHSPEGSRLNFKFDVFVLKVVPISVVYSKEVYNPAAAQELNKAFREMIASGKIMEIYHKFMESKE